MFYFFEILNLFSFSRDMQQVPTRYHENYKKWSKSLHLIKPLTMNFTIIKACATLPCTCPYGDGLDLCSLGYTCYSINNSSSFYIRYLTTL
jgi:hypothetical protein